MLRPVTVLGRSLLQAVRDRATSALRLAATGGLAAVFGLQVWHRLSCQVKNRYTHHRTHHEIASFVSCASCYVVQDSLLIDSDLSALFEIDQRSTPARSLVGSMRRRAVCRARARSRLASRCTRFARSRRARSRRCARSTASRARAPWSRASARRAATEAAHTSQQRHVLSCVVVDT